jgi:hypothetical protein
MVCIRSLARLDIEVCNRCIVEDALSEVSLLCTHRLYRAFSTFSEFELSISSQDIAEVR